MLKIRTLVSREPRTELYGRRDKISNYITISQTKYLGLNGRKIAYFTNKTLGSPRNYTMVTIMGVVASEEYKDENESPVIDIEKVVDIEFKKRVISKLREKEPNLKGLNESNFNFWHWGLKDR